MSVRGRAWTALLLPPVTWFVFEQGLSALLHANCGRAWWGLPWGAASLIVCAGAFRLAWPLGRRQSTLTDPWLARLALLGAGLFALAITLQLLAVAIAPACLA